MKKIQPPLKNHRKTSFFSGPQVFCLVFFLFFPVGAYAQIPGACEVGVAAVAAEAVDKAQVAAVKAVTAAMKAVYNAGIKAAQNAIINDSGQGQLTEMDKDIIKKLDWLWENWRDSLRLMTKQFSAGMIEQSRQIAANYDAKDIITSGLDHQRFQFQGRKTYQPTNQVCQFDTTAKYLSHSKGRSTSMMKGYAKDFSKIGNADKDSPAAGGPATLQKARWDIYKDKFCDPKSNNGASGCTTATEMTNAHILPSKTIFTKETIDLEEPDTAEAVSQLLFNITGYEVPELIPETALKATAGLEQRQEDREYVAQMDAVSALATAVIADRMPGQEAPEIKEMRQKSGVPEALISDKPSHREIRQAIIEQLWNPNYFKELYDNPNTISQKELYLKAYGLVMLYDMIEKQEKISTVYAIETANMLDKSDNSRHGASGSAPVKQGN
ncbi:MAG: hypothetical protein K8R48_02560 [Alphaproteobacteria bacterium]|nr:hypothetical protein [Alphaproteobacteria bacterium]